MRVHTAAASLCRCTVFALILAAASSAMLAVVAMESHANQSIAMAHHLLMCSTHQLSILCSAADDNYGVFDLLDSNDTTSPLEPVTDPNTIAEYPNLGDESSCTSNCLFKRSKDDVSVTSGPKEFNDFTDTVAL